ncbi:hypothetical protein CAL13_07835 [Bordetella genomosp. 9]|uniref:Cupin type-2 domain-containing protein n=2 Tax=Bordetella genomosp. 9 TaxID=1416803 RepID=A0A1W6YYQ2_9BORD|nr:hypothetical protein CAL13_07835 [Bordetella genomosp. 9]
MSSGNSGLRMAALPVGRARSPATAAQARARYFNSANAFNIALPEVTARVFTEPPRMAAVPYAASGFYACDQSDQLGCAYPATTPFMLARYARIQAGESIVAPFAERASSSIWYVMAGRGTVSTGAGVDTGSDERLAFGSGDVFLLPCRRTELTADADHDVLLWVVTDEPLLAALELAPRAGIGQAVHFTRADIAAHMDSVQAATPDADTSGRAVVFSCEALEEKRNIMPALTLSLNTLAPGGSQAAHRHNSAALTLVLSGTSCHSMLGGVRCAWEEGATLVTPAGVAHSHHNEGDARADFLIVQDGGLYYEGRTMGFAWTSDPA